MWHNAAFHQGLHCFLRQDRSSEMFSSEFIPFMIRKRCKHATYSATGYFQCKENHFEIPKRVKKQFKTSITPITKYLFVEIYPSAILKHYFSISTLIPSLKKIGKKMPKIESENKFLTSIKGYNSVLIS